MVSQLIQNRLQQKCVSLTLKHLINQYKRSYSTSVCNLPKMGLLLKTIVNKINSFAPISLAESWDNVGLLVEPPSREIVKKIILTNDLTPAVLQEAIHVDADMIVSYHPPIFSPFKRIVVDSWKERIIASCLENKIAVYSPHTSFDAIPGGVNDWLASAFDTKSVEPIIQSYASSSKSFMVEITDISDLAVLKKIKILAESISTEDIKGIISETDGNLKLSMRCSKASLAELAEIVDSIGSGDKSMFTVKKNENVPLPGFGMGRLCTLVKPTKLNILVDCVKSHLNLGVIKVAEAVPNDINTIAVCAGSGASVLRGVKADLYLTGEMSHHEVLDAVHTGHHVILCGHSNSERGYLNIFAKKLYDILEGNVHICLSKEDLSPCIYL